MTDSSTIEANWEKYNSAEKIKTEVLNVLGGAVEKAAQTMLKGIVDIDELKNFVKGNVGEQLTQNIRNALAEAGKALVNSAIDELTGALGVKLEPDVKGPAHEYTTEAVAGASGAQTAIAGSVAIAVINGRTEAFISSVSSPGVNTVTASGNVSFPSTL